MQQNAPLPLADSSVFAALSQPDVGVANVANLIDIPGAASNAPRLSSFSYFANRGPANQVDSQVCLQPTGLVAIMHTTTHTSHDKIEEETKRKEICCAYDVDVRASHDEIEEEEVQSLETKSQVTPPLSETTTLLDTQPSTPVCVGRKLDEVVEDDKEEDMCHFNARLACLRDASCSGCKFCHQPEEQHPCNAYDVNVCSSDVFALITLRRRISDRCAANMIHLVNDNNFMAALHIQISKLEFDLCESQKQVNGLVYATYNQIWEMKETREMDEINLQNDKMKIDQIILDVNCNTPDCFNLPQRQYSTHIQRMPPIKGSEIDGSWGIRLLTRTSTPFSKQKKTKAKKAVHLSNHPAVYIVVKGKCVLKKRFGTARVIWAMLMLVLFDAAGVLVPAPQPPKIFRPGRTVQNAIFFALLVMALFLSY